MKKSKRDIKIVYELMINKLIHEYEDETGVEVYHVLVKYNSQKEFESIQLISKNRG